MAAQTQTHSIRMQQSHSVLFLSFFSSFKINRLNVSHCVEVPQSQNKITALVCLLFILIFFVLQYGWIQHEPFMRCPLIHPKVQSLHFVPVCIFILISLCLPNNCLLYCCFTQYAYNSDRKNHFHGRIGKKTVSDGSLFFCYEYYYVSFNICLTHHILRIKIL